MSCMPESDNQSIADNGLTERIFENVSRRLIAPCISEGSICFFNCDFNASEATPGTSFHARIVSADPSPEPMLFRATEKRTKLTPCGTENAHIAIRTIAVHQRMFKR